MNVISLKNSSPTIPNSMQLSDTPANPETESRFAEIEMEDPVRITDSNEPVTGALLTI